MARRAEQDRETSNIQHPKSNIEGKNHRTLGRIGEEPRRFRTRKRRIPSRHGQIRQNQNRRGGVSQSAAIRDKSRHDPRHAVLDVNPRPTFIPDFATPRFRLTPRHFAYVKIAEGCNHPCSFCIIPRMRGSHRSRQQADIVAEAKALHRRRREGNQSDFAGLDLLRTRFAPEPQPRHFVAGEIFRRRQIACRRCHDDLHAAARIEFAARAISGSACSTPIRRIGRTNSSRPSPSARRSRATWTSRSSTSTKTCSNGCGAKPRSNTSWTSSAKSAPACRASRCGRRSSSAFPAKPRRAFKTLLDFIRETKFERLGVFTYSQGRRHARRRDGRANSRQDQTTAPRTGDGRAAQNRPAGFRILRRPRNQSPRRRQGQRRSNLQAANVSSWEHGLIREAGNSATPQLRNSETYLVARGEADAPDIDGRVYVRGKLPIGEFARVKVIGHTDYDLIAEPVS